MKIVIKLLILSVVFYILNFCVGYGYLENKYYCNISNNTIIIGLKKKDGFTKCVDIIKDLNTGIIQITKNLETIQNFLDKNIDYNYYISLKKSLSIEREKYITIKNTLIQYLIDYEKILFKKIKKLVEYKLEKEENTINRQLAFESKKLKTIIENGDIKIFNQQQEKIENLVNKKFFFDNIKNSNGFEELIYLLKNYLNIIKI